MKFLHRINRNYFILLSILLLISSFAGFYALRNIVLNETKESLLEKEALLIKQIAESDEIINLYPVIEVKKMNSLTSKVPEIKEIMIQDKIEDELEPYLEYSHQIKINDACYSIKLRQSIFENEDLVAILALTLFVILSAAFGISFFIGKKLNKSIWADFEYNLHTIESFSFKNKENIILLKSDIQEFDRLNRIIENLTEKLRTDYFALKEFTENASHEIQTPIAIALLNLDEILQQDLSEEVFKKTLTTINSLKRLSSLNQGLILLAKIENNQFKADKDLIINDIIEKSLKEFASLIESKKLNADYLPNEIFKLKISTQLADILINNLLSNAIKHNIQDGSIRIIVEERGFKIFNTGGPNSLSNENIFNRFSKGNSASYGLGLAIVKKICETHHLKITYSKDNQHCFSIYRQI